MSTPFTNALEDIIQGFEPAEPSIPPSLKCLRFCLSSLAGQKEKLLSINSGLIESVCSLYDVYLSLANKGTAWSAMDQYLYRLDKPEFDLGNVDMTAASRLALVQILKSLIVYMPGRERFFSSLSLSVLAEWLQDPCSQVQMEVLHLLSSLQSYKDTSAYLLVPFESKKFPAEYGQCLFGTALVDIVFQFIDNDSYILHHACTGLLRTIIDYKVSEMITYKVSHFTNLLKSVYTVLSTTVPDAGDLTIAEKSKVKYGLTGPRQLQHIRNSIVIFSGLAKDLKLVPILLNLRVPHQVQLDVYVTLLHCVYTASNQCCKSILNDIIILLSHVSSHPVGILALARDVNMIKLLAMIINKAHNAVPTNNTGTDSIKKNEYLVSTSMYEVVVTIIRHVAKANEGLTNLALHLNVAPNVLSTCLLGNACARIASVPFASYQDTQYPTETTYTTLHKNQPDLLRSLQLLEIMLQEGQRESVLEIVDVLEILKALTKHTNDTETSPIYLLSSKCLNLLCPQTNDSKYTTPAMKV